MSIASRTLGLITDIDGLYASVAMAPDEWDEYRFAEWTAEHLGARPLDKEPVRLFKQGIRRAQRLQKYWMGRDAGPSDWRQRVDEALGSAGWKPALELARWGLEQDPDEALYEEYAARFQAVEFQPPSERLEDFETKASASTVQGTD